MLGIPTCTVDGPLRPGAGAWVQRPFGPLYHCRHGSASVQLYQSYRMRSVDQLELRWCSDTVMTYRSA